MNGRRTTKTRIFGQHKSALKVLFFFIKDTKLDGEGRGCGPEKSLGEDEYDQSIWYQTPKELIFNVSGFNMPSFITII